MLLTLRNTLHKSPDRFPDKIRAINLAAELEKGYRLPLPNCKAEGASEKLVNGAYSVSQKSNCYKFCYYSTTLFVFTDHA